MPMTYLVVSDLHGSSKGLDLLQAAVFMQKPDVLIVLGDILFGSYDGNEGAVQRYFRSLTIPVLGVRGNCDFADDARSLGFELPEQRTFTFAGRTFHLQHRPWCASFEPGDIALCGHTHVKCLYKEAGIFYLNPGSLGRPRDDGPGFAVINDEGIALYDASKFIPIKSLKYAS